MAVVATEVEEAAQTRAEEETIAEAATAFAVAVAQGSGTRRPAPGCSGDGVVGTKAAHGDGCADGGGDSGGDGGGNSDGSG
jgi:hypothetical protein